MWTRIALYATLGYALDVLGHSWNSWGFWAILGLFWASEHMTRIEVLEQIHREVEQLRSKNNKDKQ